jgi:hypothetical protein
MAIRFTLWLTAMLSAILLAIISYEASGIEMWALKRDGIPQVDFFVSWRPFGPSDAPLTPDLSLGPTFEFHCDSRYVSTVFVVIRLGLESFLAVIYMLAGYCLYRVIRRMLSGPKKKRLPCWNRGG